MTEIYDVLYPPKENDTCVSHRRYDANERLVVWCLRQDDHFLLFRVDAFREVTLENGEKRDVPETIQCRFSQMDTEPNAAFADECTISYDSHGTIASGAEADCSLGGFYAWAGRELDAESQFHYSRARCFQGRWIGGEPLGHTPGNDNFLPYPQ
jgi:hypothetical protein